MPTSAAPRHFSPGAGLPGAGLPGDRGARLAARQVFVDLKLSFLAALEQADDAEWLRTQVRAAGEPVDLWLLRAPVFSLLAGTAPEQQQRRRQLRRGLDSVFPALDPASAFGPF
ncbi:MAG: hypothetical protein LH480_05585 [Rubrivivax sp.]|nr:hypothetical protein [Rubrivivax sp.]